MTEQYQSLETVLGHNFDDPALLRRALTHPSEGQRGSNSVETYERMEFLGDRVLGLTIANSIYRNNPRDNAGSLARRLNAVVRREALADIAVKLNIGPHIHMSEGEQDSGGRKNPSILADVMEAIIAALYLDAGFAVAEAFILKHWADMLSGKVAPAKDPKTMLQEWAQGRGLPAPTYQVVERTGPDHAPEFIVEVTVKGIPGYKGQGASKRKAEQAAAEAAMEGIKS